jgi:hypothetical protein
MKFKISYKIQAHNLKVVSSNLAPATTFLLSSTDVTDYGTTPNSLSTIFLPVGTQGVDEQALIETDS